MNTLVTGGTGHLGRARSGRRLSHKPPASSLDPF
jgi:hypothetical protein